MSASRSSSRLTTPSATEIVGVREFDAPRDLVYTVFTDPTLIPRWWGPRNVVTRVEAMDVRPGGAWRYVHTDESGGEVAFSGVYREVVAPERLVQTFNFEPVGPGHEVIETTVFEVLAGGRTRVTSHQVYTSTEDRDATIESGMESGWSASIERLNEVLDDLTASA